MIRSEHKVPVPDRSPTLDTRLNRMHLVLLVVVLLSVLLTVLIGEQGARGVLGRAT
jgi:hypothetical protein